MKTFSFHFVSCYSREQVVSSSSLGNSSDFDAIVLSKGSAVYVQTAPPEVQPAAERAALRAAVAEAVAASALDFEESRPR